MEKMLDSCYAIELMGNVILFNPEIKLDFFFPTAEAALQTYIGKFLKL
jgi:hypothetical protein